MNLNLARGPFTKMLLGKEWNHLEPSELVNVSITNGTIKNGQDPFETKRSERVLVITKPAQNDIFKCDYIRMRLKR